MMTRTFLAAAAVLVLIGQAHADSTLQIQMQRIVALEHIDAWCAGGDHAIDYDRLRARIEAEKDKAVATRASEQAARVAYSYAEWVFKVQHPSPKLFCELAFRARTSDPGWREIFP
jgi:molybdenum cofactor biosynthesis enzyme MoaA